ncbi:hypothetical protein JW992_10500 [candidate division KSB1 bacterium]|nr:hypothetical protein [candidate division KSB1 bacterium]
MKPVFAALMALLLFLAALLFAQGAPRTDDSRVTFYHSNDITGYLTPCG